MDMDMEPEWEWEKTCQLRAQGADDNVNGARMRMRYLFVAHSRVGVGASCRMRRPSAARKARACVREAQRWSESSEVVGGSVRWARSLLGWCAGRLLFDELLDRHAALLLRSPEESDELEMA